VEIARALEDESAWTVLAMLEVHRSHAAHGPEVRALLDEVGQLLIEDELTRPLMNRLREFTAQASRLVKRITRPEPPPPSDPRWTERWTHSARADSFDAALAALDELRQRIQDAHDEGISGDSTRLELQGRLLVKPAKREA
jgi:hypothetical protein